MTTPNNSSDINKLPYEILQDHAKKIMKGNPNVTIKLNSSKEALRTFLKNNMTFLSNEIHTTSVGNTYLKDSFGGLHFSEIKVDNSDLVPNIKSKVRELIEAESLPEQTKIQIDTNFDGRIIRKNAMSLAELDDLDFSFDQSGISYYGFEGVTMNLALRPPQRGGGKGVTNVTTDSDLKGKKSIVVIDNPYDQMCAVRATLVCLYKAFKHADYDKIRRSDRFKMQREMSENICKQLGHPINKTWVFEELNLLAN